MIMLVIEILIMEGEGVCRLQLEKIDYITYIIASWCDTVIFVSPCILICITSLLLIETTTFDILYFTV